MGRRIPPARFIWAPGEQNFERHDREVQEHGGPLRALRSRLGLPRAADRNAGRKGTGRQRAKCRRRNFGNVCREYATHYVEQHKRDFKRLGVFGPWNDPYLTMSPSTRPPSPARSRFLEKGYVYRGLKPVYWCIYDNTALAEAEVEYEDHTSPSIWVTFQSGRRRQRRRREDRLAMFPR